MESDESAPVGKPGCPLGGLGHPHPEGAAAERAGLAGAAGLEAGAALLFGFAFEAFGSSFTTLLLAALALAVGRAAEALALTDRAIPVVEQAQNAALLARSQ